MHTDFIRSQKRDPQTNTVNYNVNFPHDIISSSLIVHPIRISGVSDKSATSTRRLYIFLDYLSANNESIYQVPSAKDFPIK